MHRTPPTESLRLWNAHEYMASKKQTSQNKPKTKISVTRSKDASVAVFVWNVFIHLQKITQLVIHLQQKNQT